MLRFGNSIEILEKLSKKLKVFIEILFCISCLKIINYRLDIDPNYLCWLPWQQASEKILHLCSIYTKTCIFHSTIRATLCPYHAHITHINQFRINNVLICLISQNILLYSCFESKLSIIRYNYF